MNINERIYMALKVSESSKVPLLLIGNPGVGKTTSVEYYAKLTGKKMVLLRGSQSSPEEILGYDVNCDEKYTEGVNAGKNKMTTSKLRPTWYLDILDADSKGIPTLLFLDEITTANEFIQSALLQLVFGRSLDDHNGLPESCLIVAAGNYSGNLSSTFNMIPPLMNRFCIYNVVLEEDDIDIFLSKYKYQKGFDPIKDLESFDLENSILNSYDDSFESLVRNTVEAKLSGLIKSFIKGGKYDPTVTDMTGLYTDQSNTSDTRLPGFLSPRTMCYFRDTFNSMYLNYGSNGIMSEVFNDMMLGLVGVSISNGKNGESIFNSLMSDLKSFCKTISDDLDKKMVRAVIKTEDAINKIISKLDTNGNPCLVSRIDSPKLIQVKKMIDALSNDRNVKSLESPISENIINDLCRVLSMSARGALNLKEDDLSIEDISNPSNSDQYTCDIDKFNGEIKLLNDCIRLYNSLKTFVGTKSFNYSKDIKETVDNVTGLQIFRNVARVTSIKMDTAAKLNVDMTDLVEIEKLDYSKTLKSRKK